MIPKGKDPNLTKKTIPLDAFLLYKSTATGIARASGALNVLAKNPALIAVFLIIILGIGYLTYGLSRLVFGFLRRFRTRKRTRLNLAFLNRPVSAIKRTLRLILLYLMVGIAIRLLVVPIVHLVLGV